MPTPPRPDDQDMQCQVEQARRLLRQSKRNLRQARENVRRAAEHLANAEMRAKGLDITVVLQTS